MKTFKIAAMFMLVTLMSAFTLVKSDSGYQVGDIATDFSLKNVNNQKVALADFKDAKGFIVIFTCNHCPYAKAYEDRIIALDKKALLNILWSEV